MGFGVVSRSEGMDKNIATTLRKQLKSTSRLLYSWGFRKVYTGDRHQVPYRGIRACQDPSQGVFRAFG